MNNLWTEKYRPSTLDGYVFTDANQRAQIEAWIAEKSVPNLLLSGQAGTGKSTLAKILINQLEIHPYDVLEINASRDNSVDNMRTKITNFVSTMPYGDLKIVFLDECLEENTEVVILRQGQEHLVKIKDVNDTTDLVKSFNVETNRIEWKPFKLFDKGVQDTIEIEFENNEVVICTPDHKWYVVDEHNNTIVVKTSELHNYMHILTS
jgi:DNA polymerase III gamma/tau subunit